MFGSGQQSYKNILKFSHMQPCFRHRSSLKKIEPKDFSPVLQMICYFLNSCLLCLNYSMIHATHVIPTSDMIRGNFLDCHWKTHSQRIFALSFGWFTTFWTLAWFAWMTRWSMRPMWSAGATWSMATSVTAIERPRGKELFAHSFGWSAAFGLLLDLLEWLHNPCNPCDP